MLDLLPRAHAVVIGLVAAAFVSLAPSAAATEPAPKPVAKAEKPGKPSEYDGPPLLFGERKAKLGAYAGVGAGYTRMLKRDGGLVSLEAALLFDHRLSLGLAGYGFTGTPRGPSAADGTSREFGSGYGGFVARYALFTNLPVYASLGALVGGGAVSLHDERYSGWGDDHWDSHGRHAERDWERGNFDAFFVVQPEVSLHTNVRRWLRLGLSGGYRFTSCVCRFGLDASDLRGVVFGGNLQLGWF